MILSTGGVWWGGVAGGHVWQGGHVWLGGMHGQLGHAWPGGMCVAGGVHGWWVCMARGHVQLEGAPSDTMAMATAYGQ